MSVLLLLLTRVTSGSCPERLIQALCVYETQQGASLRQHKEGIG